MQNFGRKNFDDSTCTRQICQTFTPSKFYKHYTVIPNILAHWEDVAYSLKYDILKVDGIESTYKDDPKNVAKNCLRLVEYRHAVFVCI